MNSWIMVINNVLQSVVEGCFFKDRLLLIVFGDLSFSGMDFGLMFVGKSLFFLYGNYYNFGGILIWCMIVGVCLVMVCSSSFEEWLDRFFQLFWDNDQGNLWCVDCGLSNKVEWVLFNLVIIVCIECSGIYWFFGMYISKI